jgi:hypothetical protein
MGAFKILIKFENGSQIVDTDWTQDFAVIQDALVRLVRGPGRFVVKEILVIDDCDCTVFLRRDGVQIWPEAA